MFNVVLFKPQIPPNTGNIIRLCSNTGSKIHLIKPLGFSTDKKSLRRAGLDYLKNIKINIYENVDHFLMNNLSKNFYLVSKYAKINYTKIYYKPDDYFVFGSETSGLSEEVYLKFKKSKKIFIPMFPDNRSINLANTVGICIYEAWRQNNFKLV